MVWYCILYWSNKACNTEPHITVDKCEALGYHLTSSITFTFIKYCMHSNFMWFVLLIPRYFICILLPNSLQKLHAIDIYNLLVHLPLLGKRYFRCLLPAKKACTTILKVCVCFYESVFKNEQILVVVHVIYVH